MYYKDIEKRVLEIIPPECEVAHVEPEGLSTVIYIRNIQAFYKNDQLIRELAGSLKKKVIVRVERSQLMDIEQAKAMIESLVPKDAEIRSILFNPEFSEVHIEALKPGLVIGKGGSVLKEIVLRTGWMPITVRAPTMPSVTLDGVRKSLIAEAADRKKFLLGIGRKICQPTPVSEWARILALGGFREVGRSCFLLQTPHSKIILDCGANTATNEPTKAYPYLNMLGFNLEEIDAVIISHGHMDHMGFVPYLFEYGYDGPVYCTPPTRDIMVLLQQDYVNLAKRSLTAEAPYSKKHIQKELRNIIAVNYGEVVDITPEVKMTLYNAGHILGSAAVHLHIGEGMHNLVYSLDGNTPVVVVDKKNRTHVVKIGEFIDCQFERQVHEIGFVERARNLEGWRAFAFNPKTLKSELVPVTSFIRHPISEDLYEITTRTGRKAMVTASHSVFQAKGGEIIARKVKELSIGDYIIGPKELPVPSAACIIELPEHMRTYENRIEEIEKKVQTLMPKIKSQFPEQEKRELVVKFVRDHWTGLYMKDIGCKHCVNIKRVRRAFRLLGLRTWPRVKDALPKQLEISPDLARFIGYYVSEGCTTDTNTVLVTNYSEDILEDCLKIIQKELGIVGKMVRHEAQFYSKQLRQLLEFLGCGKNAFEKRVPKELFLAPQENILQFLRGYLAGDGSIRIRSKGVSVNGTSKSEGLVQDLGLLFLRVGIPTTYNYNKTSKMYNIDVYGFELVDQLVGKLAIKRWQEELAGYTKIKNKCTLFTKIPLNALSHPMQTALEKTAYQNARSGDRRIIEERFECTEEDKRLIHSSFLFDEIKEIKKVKPTGNYVYDLQIDGYENFVGGLGHLYLHNTGDFKFGFTKLFEPAQTHFPRVETLIIESTYGGRNDITPQRMQVERKLLDIIRETMQRRGKVLIPVFAVGRSQEILLVLEEFYRRFPQEFNYPVYIDGMVLEASAIHTAYPEYLREQLQRRILSDNSPFESPMVKVARGTDKETIVNGEPAVILAPSGMLSGGPSYEYLKLMADDPRNMLAFVGYQSALSLGRKIQEGLKEVPILGDDGKTKMLKINMQVETADGFSGHSDRGQLIGYLRNIRPTPERVITLHGDYNKTEELARAAAMLLHREGRAMNNLEALRLR